MTKILTPVKAIRAKCLDCSGDSPKEVRMCHLKDCPLWPYRLGKNPNRKGRTLTPEQKAEAVERLANARKTGKDDDRSKP